MVLKNAQLSLMLNGQLTVSATQNNGLAGAGGQRITGSSGACRVAAALYREVWERGYGPHWL